MRKSIFGQGKHLKDIASEGTLNHVEIDLGEILAHGLLASIIDQNVNLAVPENAVNKLSIHDGKGKVLGKKHTA